MYDNAPDGLAGNEDCGQMSAWYVFSAIGFYPVNPASGEYVFGSPLVDQSIMLLPSGSTFRINVLNNSTENKYIQSIDLNGKAIYKSLYHPPRYYDRWNNGYKNGLKTQPKIWHRTYSTLPGSMSFTEVLKRIQHLKKGPLTVTYAGFFLGIKCGRFWFLGAGTIEILY